jgi:cytochrome c oxidase subunit II
MNKLLCNNFSKLVFFAIYLALLPISNALAQSGYPVPRQTGFQEPATEIMERIEWLHNSVMLPMCYIIVAFVLLLLVYTCFRFRKSANPVPSKTTHNTFIEIIWTVIPVVILVGIAIPSFRLLYFENIIPESPTEISVTNGVVSINGESKKESKITVNNIEIKNGVLVKDGKAVYKDSFLDGDSVQPATEGSATIGNAELLVDGKPYIDTLTLKIVGYQWYWGYEYPDNGIAAYDSVMSTEPPKDGEFRLLEVDNEVVLPVDTNIRIQVTGADVIHSWAIPSFGIKIDAVPGRLNEGWFNIKKEGVFYGQCSELCGKSHAFMPIKVRAVSKDAFRNWVVEAQKKYSDNSDNKNIAFK